MGAQGPGSADPGRAHHDHALHDRRRGKFAPRLSPDGEKVAYVWAGPNDDNWDIYVKAVGPGTKPLRITEDPATDVSPTWSPDGRQIAFVRVSADDTAAIYTIPSLGGQERKLVDVIGPARRIVDYFVPMLSWAPDGEWLAFAEKASEDAPARIVRLSLATLEKRPLTSPPPGFAGRPRAPDLAGWAPPGLRPVGRSGLGNQDVWVQPVGGGEARRLTFGKYARATALSWTPDGAEIVFSDASAAEDGPGTARGRSAPAGRGGGRERRRRLRPRESDGVHPEARRRSRTSGGSRAPAASAVHRRRRRSSSPPAPTRRTRRTAGRSLSSRRRGGTNNIWLSDADGSHPVQLTTSKSDSGTPRWSPDGRRLVFDSLEAGNWDLYVVGVDGGMPRRLTQEPSEDGTGTWSRDGRSIYFHSDRTGRSEIWKIPADGGTAVQVTRSGGFYAVESEDGRDLYYSKSPAIGNLACAPLGWRRVGSGEGARGLGGLGSCPAGTLLRDGAAT